MQVGPTGGPTQFSVLGASTSPSLCLLQKGVQYRKVTSFVPCNIDSNDRGTISHWGNEMIGFGV